MPFPWVATFYVFSQIIELSGALKPSKIAVAVSPVHTIRSFNWTQGLVPQLALGVQRVVLDDDRAKWGPRVAGVRVEGGITDLVLPHVLAGATHVIVAMTGATPEHQARVLNLARQTGLAVVSLPPRGVLQDDEVLAEAG